MRFDVYLMVDWSAANTPRSGKDSIWWTSAVWTRRGPRLERTDNPRTRAEALRAVGERLTRALSRGEDVLLGVDFALGYPQGTAAALGLPGVPWRALWNEWNTLVRDAEDNANNRFEVAAALNARISAGAGPFWARPRGMPLPGLTENRPFAYPVQGLAERRLTDSRAPGAHSPWKLFTTGAVGSQSLLGIPRLHQLLEDSRLAGRLCVWPFQTGFTLPPRSPGQGRIVLAEVYPSLLKPRPPADTVPDRFQVEALARHFAEHDRAETLAALFAPPEGLTPTQRDAVLQEEGWILGVR